MDKMKVQLLTLQCRNSRVRVSHQGAGSPKGPVERNSGSIAYKEKGKEMTIYFHELLTEKFSFMNFSLKTFLSVQS